MPFVGNVAPMQRVYEKRFLRGGYGIFPVPVTLPPQVMAQYQEPKIINIQAKSSALRGRRW